MIKELGKLKAEAEAAEGVLGATDRGILAIQARETGSLRRNISFVLRKA